MLGRALVEGGRPGVLVEKARRTDHSGLELVPDKLETRANRFTDGLGVGLWREESSII